MINKRVNPVPEYSSKPTVNASRLTQVSLNSRCCLCQFLYSNCWCKCKPLHYLSATQNNNNNSCLCCTISNQARARLVGQFQYSIRGSSKGSNMLQPWKLNAWTTWRYVDNESDLLGERSFTTNAPFDGAMPFLLPICKLYWPEILLSETVTISM